MDGRPCERCGNLDKLHGGSSESYEDSYEDEEQSPASVPALCAEVQMAFGLIGWLCHDCRKEYFRMAKDHPLTAEYGEASLRLEFWKARVGSGNMSPTLEEHLLEKGLVLWRSVEEIERNVNVVANQWLVSEVDFQRSK